MAFVYERIPEADVVAFGLREIDKQFPMATASRWVIDRERNIYLRYMTYDREQPSQKNFSFFWKGILLRLRFNSEGQSLDGDKWQTSWSWLGMHEPEADVKAGFEANRASIMADLKDALRAYRDGSLSPAYSAHIAVFDF
ncbi:hypothetical protein UNDYM_5100 [Undibacterium sp. YM2]|uniref:hypothetical protein n=1 Tax=Undibacterium sp. YM2 TaxID=2058625 RepID=UPI001331C71B|nr:hypothetical protein [Undibacterium sp. YM2]BBB69353.1 hypothetical protein UNDYM_5100 [Undibacterium sp. YM2]